MLESAVTGMRDDTSARWASRLLVTGGALSALMGAAHFVLPVLYPWEQHAEGLYAPVRWALFATTVFFGLLLLFGGILTALVARARDLPPRVAGWVVGGMAAFWVLAAAYEIVVPFPATGARWALPVFSVIVGVLHLAGLWLRSPRPARPESRRRPPGTG